LEAFKSPPRLYYRGYLNALDFTRSLSVVGSRMLTQSNQRALTHVLSPIRDTDLTIISGLALGMDARAHTLAIENHLPTVAVLGSSVEPNEIYPRTNAHLAEAIIASGGLLLSPFAPKTPILRHNFPARNTIIAGLTQATLVASAAQKSGALITARFALDYGRDVMIIPGNVDDPLFAGSNSLLKDGAMPITGPNDILDYFNLGPHVTKQYDSSSSDEKLILESLKRRPQTADELSAAVNAPISDILLAVTQFELKGWITKLPDGTIQLI